MYKHLWALICFYVYNPNLHLYHWRKKFLLPSYQIFYVIIYNIIANHHKIIICKIIIWSYCLWYKQIKIASYIHFYRIFLITILRKRIINSTFSFFCINRTEHTRKIYSFTTPITSIWTCKKLNTRVYLTKCRLF